MARIRIYAELGINTNPCHGPVRGRQAPLHWSERHTPCTTHQATASAPRSFPCSRRTGAPRTTLRTILCALRPCASCAEHTARSLASSRRWRHSELPGLGRGAYPVTGRADRASPARERKAPPWKTTFLRCRATTSSRPRRLGSAPSAAASARLGARSACTSPFSAQARLPASWSLATCEPF